MSSIIYVELQGSYDVNIYVVENYYVVVIRGYTIG